MDIYYRILNINAKEHSIEVRYWSDELNEFDLCSLFNPNGSPKLTLDGYPERCRTDCNITLYDTPSPNDDQLKTIIMNNAPIAWFRLIEDVRSNSIDTSMSSIFPKLKKVDKFTVQIPKRT